MYSNIPIFTSISLKTCLIGVVVGTMLPNWTLYVLSITTLICVGSLPTLKNRFDFFDVFNTLCTPQIGAIIGLTVNPNLFLVACIFSSTLFIDVFLYMRWRDNYFGEGLIHDAPYNYSLKAD